MSRKALKVTVEINFRAVSCPGVHLPSKDDIYLSMCFMGQYQPSECLPAVFPLLFRERMTFEKIFRHAVDPGDIAVMLEYETVRIELVQLIPPGGDTLACFEEDARRFLFPEPKLVPSFSGVEREVLMTRAPYFPGIAPRLEFSTKTTIIECSADAEISVYPSVPMRPVIKRNRKHSSRPRTSSPQRKQPQNLGWRRGGITGSASRISRSQSLSPLRAGNTQRLAQLNLNSAAPGLCDWDTTRTSQPVSRDNTTLFQSQPADGREELNAGFVAWSQGTCLAPPLCTINQLFFTFDQVFVHSDTFFNWQRKVFIKRLERYQKTTPALLKHMMPLTTTEVLTLQDCGSLIGNTPGTAGPFHDEFKRSQSSSHREWEEVQERVRKLITTPKAVRRLVYGATHSEIDKVLARRSISPGPP